MDDDRRLASGLPATPPAPAHLADRVLAAVREPEPRARRWPGADLALVAALAAALFATRGRRWDGVVTAGARTTVGVGNRGTAVAEAGAMFTYHVDDAGAARVVQGGGRVFYRVEPGGPFVVATPAGEVRVTGTCFSVEVDETMRTTTKTVTAGAVGAALAVLVTVSVYEGRVILASPRGGERELVAGQNGRLETGAPPSVGPAAPAAKPAAGSAPSVAALARAVSGEAAGPVEVVTLRTRVVQLEKQLEHMRSQLDEAARQAGMALRVNPSKEDLASWAKTCAVHLDAPAVFGTSPRSFKPEEVEEMGITADELPILEAAQADAHERTLLAMRRIYVAATGDATGVDQLSAGAMLSEIMDKADEQTTAEARRQLAAERAGLVPAPADPTKRPPIEQAYRLIGTVGVDLEAQLSTTLGAARARELRQQNNGWQGLRLDSDGCPK